MEKKIELYGRVTIPIILICLRVFTTEYALLRIFGGGTLIDRAADFVNEIARTRGRVHYTTIALTGIVCNHNVSICYFASYREYALPAKPAAQTSGEMVVRTYAERELRKQVSRNSGCS